jgi:hypothetical protein
MTCMGERLTKVSCWELKKCCQQPRGNNAHDKGLCPDATDDALLPGKIRKKAAAE